MSGNADDGRLIVQGNKFSKKFNSGWSFVSSLKKIIAALSKERSGDMIVLEVI